MSSSGTGLFVSRQLSAPGNALAVGQDKQVQLAWDAVAGADSYNIYFAGAAGVTKGNYNTLNGGKKVSSTDTSLLFSSLANGQDYHFVVTAAQKAGESVESNEALATPLAVAGPPAPPTLKVPGAPKNFLVLKTAIRRLLLSCDAIADATSYSVYFATAPGIHTSNYQTIAGGLKTQFSAPPFDFSSLVGGKTYYFVVTALNAQGEGAESAEISGVPIIDLPLAPQKVQATPGNGQIALTWPAVPSATGYNVYSATVPGVSAANYATLQQGLKTPAANSTPTLTGLANAKSYYIVVTALNATGESSESLEVSARPIQPISALTVNTFLPSPDGVAPNGGVAPGAAIKINGVAAGVTDATGTLVVNSLLADSIYIEAGAVGGLSGQSILKAPFASATLQTNIILDGGKEKADGSLLVIDEVVNGVLDTAFTTLTLRLKRADNSAVQLSSVPYMALPSPIGGAASAVTAMFSLAADGNSIALTDAAGFQALISARTGKIEIEVNCTGADGLTHDLSAFFYIGKFSIKGMLAAPPSNPQLNLSGIVVTATTLNLDLVFKATSDASGAFKFTLVPPGGISISCSTLQGGLTYTGHATFAVDSHKNLIVNMLSNADVVAGVAAFSISVSSTASANGMPRVDPGRWQAKILKDSSGASVHVIAGTQNDPVTQTASLTIPKGTKTVTLKYTVSSAEYPYYVTAQSVYNDLWTLRVASADGSELKYLSVQVNSMLYFPPVFQSDGSTGEIDELLNVEALAAAADTSITLTASAMNIGDSVLPTSVSASVSVENSIKIGNLSPVTFSPTNNDGSYFSIPRPGATNYYDRFFTVKVSKPKGAQIKKVTVTLMNGATALGTVVDSAVDGYLVQEIDEETLQVKVSFDSASTVASQPPPTHTIKYHFKVVATTSDNVDVSDEKDSANLKALWRMPDGFPRFGTRDAGGDDWCSHGTYNWLVANQALTTSINDISGEHGRDIEHKTHDKGTDIDMYHFYKFPGAADGKDNYLKLVSDVLIAFQTDTNGVAAKARVSAWAAATRTGITNLTANTQVLEIRHILGEKITAAIFPPGRRMTLADTNEALSETNILLSHADANDGLVHVGDMRFTVEQLEKYKSSLLTQTKSGRSSFNASYLMNRWPTTTKGGLTTSVLPILLDGSLTDAEKTAFGAAEADWEAAANVTFVTRTNEADYIKVVDAGPGYDSYVGKVGVGGEQILHVGGPLEFKMCHELGHALGLIHEQSRSDRDSFVVINTANISAGNAHNFDKVPGSLNNGAYDFDSVEHYTFGGFTKYSLAAIDFAPVAGGNGFTSVIHAYMQDNDAGTLAGAGVTVTFTVTGPGSFPNGTKIAQTPTDANGKATSPVFTTTAAITANAIVQTMDFAPGVTYAGVVGQRLHLSVLDKAGMAAIYPLDILSEGWARDLLVTGKCMVSGQLLDLGSTWGGSNKYVPVNDHNDHVHVALSRASFGE